LCIVQQQSSHHPAEHGCYSKVQVPMLPRESPTSQIAVSEDKPEPVSIQTRSAEEFKLPWWARSRHRAKYHELKLLKDLARQGWSSGRRFTASGPFLGLVDCYATKDTPGKYIIGLFQIKPRLRTLSAYFSGVQVLSLLLLETVYAAKYHSDIIQVDKVLVAVLRTGTVYHQLTPEDVERAGLTTAILDRIALTDPIGSMRTLKAIPSPIEKTSSGKALPDYYAYLGSTYLVLRARDKSNWSP